MESESVEDDLEDMVTPIPPPLDEPLKTYLAVQLKPREVSIHVVKAVMGAAKDLGILFRRLEVLDTMTMGTLSFVRMRTEMLAPYTILDRLYSDGRSVISSMNGGEYMARLLGGRVGKVNNLVMHATPKLGQAKMYRGTKIKHWERQFEAA
jgi:hypothetical protein